MAPLGSERSTLGFLFQPQGRVGGRWVGGTRSGSRMLCRSPRAQILLTGIWNIIASHSSI